MPRWARFRGSARTETGGRARSELSPVAGPAPRGGRVLGVAASLGAAVALGTLATLPEYGITSDEPVIYHGGERQWWAMWSDHPDRWDFKKPPPADFQLTAPFSLHPDPRDVYRFPGFPGLFCVVVARLARFVPGYDRVDAVHAGIAVLHALTVFVMVLYLARLLDCAARCWWQPCTPCFPRPWGIPTTTSRTGRRRDSTR
jgi:hypothetical protein